MKAVILAARRTPIGVLRSVFKDLSAVDLGVAAAKPIVAGLLATDFADVIVGNVLQAGQGMNPARQIALRSGLSVEIPGQTVNRVCGSGMQAVICAVQGLQARDGRLYLSGGTESMSNAPFLVPELRNGRRMGDSTLVDSMVHDGLTDPTHCYHMGITAESIAARWSIDRATQDAFAALSHQKANLAQRNGSFRPEIVAVEVPARKGSFTVDSDEGVRAETDQRVLAELRPAFRPDGVVTAGNASGLNDGAAMLAVSDDEYARAHGIHPLATILGYAIVGVDPAYMGMGPAAAIPLSLQRAGLTVADIDLFELNEAFAAQCVAVCREVRIPEDRVNVRGGAIALGHPIGASGARLIVTLIHALRSMNKELGIASLCIGGGMGIAMVLRSA